MRFTARDVMTTPVVSVRADTSIDEVCSLLLRHHISGLPVVDDDNRLLAVISELDLLRLLCAQECQGTTVRDYWTTDVISVWEREPVHEIVEVFLAHQIRRVPVVTADNQLVGIISRREVVRLIREVRMRMAAELEALKRARQVEPATCAS
jgi:CBS domain-containing protein